MYSVPVVVKVAWFALAWFILGVYVGRCLPPITPAAKRKPRRKKSRGSGTATELYVGNLAYSVSKREISKHFSKFGEVVDVRLIRNRASGKSRGYGFVVMADTRSADKAVQEMNGADIKGRAIVVNEAKSRSRD
jgi:RNA recognition motif-containing protein